MTSDSDLKNARAVAPLRDAQQRLNSAVGDLDNVAFKPLRYLPLFGRQLRSATALARSGAQASGAVADVLAGLRELTRTPPAPDHRVDVLKQFQAIVTTARLRLAEVDLGPTRGLLTTLAQTRNDLSIELGRATAALNKAVAVSNAVLDLVTGHHTALLLLANNAEMRAGSGMPNVLGLARFDDGRVVVDSTVRSQDVPVPAGAVAATGDFGARWGWLQPTTDWQELLSSPRFDVTAALAEKMWQASGHPAVDAVMVVDPYALQAILAATGPIPFGSRTINATTVIPELLHDQYEQYGDQQTAARHEEIGILTQAAIARLDAGGWSASTLGLDLATAVRSRHLMVWSATPADELAWTIVGAGGALAPDSVMVSLLNRGRNKEDYFTYTNAGIQPHVTPSGTDVTMTIVVDNRSPATDVPYVIGPGGGIESVVRPGETVAAGDYVGVLAVTLPQRATDIRIADDPAPVVFGPDGPTMVIGEQYLIPRGSHRVVTVQFHLPVGTRSVRLQPAARFPSLFWRLPTGNFIPADGTHLLTW
jgi:hypothetical protein